MKKVLIIFLAIVIFVFAIGCSNITSADVCIATDLIMQSHRLYGNTDGTITLANYVVAGEITYP